VGSSERRKEHDRRLPAAHAQGARWTRAVSPALPSALVCGLFFIKAKTKHTDWLPISEGWDVGKQALGWWQINCRVRKRRESGSEAACMITKRWLSIHCALAHLPDHRQCPLGQPTVRAPFEDQPCHRGTKRNNRQIKVGQSARSLRVAQLSKRAC
jgi:hypothetical protein